MKGETTMEEDGSIKYTGIEFALSQASYKAKDLLEASNMPKKASLLFKNNVICKVSKHLWEEVDRGLVTKEEIIKRAKREFRLNLKLFSNFIFKGDIKINYFIDLVTESFYDNMHLEEVAGRVKTA